MHRVASLTRIVLALLWTGLTAIPFLPALILLLPWRYGRIVLSAIYGRVFAGPSLMIFGIRPHYEGLEHLRGVDRCVFVTNHSSNVDPFFGLWFNRIGHVGIAKREITRIPVFGLVYYLSGHLLIDRSDRDSTRDLLAGAVEVIRRHGLGLWLWPEGTQCRDGRLLPFKKGFVHLAISTGLPVVPVVVHDAHLRWPARTLDVRPGPLRVQVLEPISTEGWTAERAREHADAVHARFVEALAPHQRPLESA